MYYPRFIKQAKSIEQLLRKYPYKRCAEASELVLLDQLVQVDTE